MLAPFRIVYVIMLVMFFTTFVFVEAGLVEPGGTVSRAVLFYALFGMATTALLVAILILFVFCWPHMRLSKKHHKNQQVEPLSCPCSCHRIQDTEDRSPTLRY